MSHSKPLIARICAGLLASAFALPWAAQAHYFFAAEFDVQKVVHLEGTAGKFAWVKPHSWLYVDVKKPDGSTEQWKIEGGAPSALLRRGWNRNSLPMGTKIVVNAFQARDGARASASRHRVPGWTPPGIRRRRIRRGARTAGKRTRGGRASSCRWGLRSG